MTLGLKSRSYYVLVMALHCFPEQGAVSIVCSIEKVGSGSEVAVLTHRCCFGLLGSYLSRGKQKKDIKPKLKLGTETAGGILPTKLKVASSVAGSWQQLFYLEKILPDIFSNSGKSFNLSVKLKRRALWYVAAAWKLFLSPQLWEETFHHRRYFRTQLS